MNWKQKLFNKEHCSNSIHQWKSIFSYFPPRREIWNSQLFHRTGFYLLSSLTLGLFACDHGPTKMVSVAQQTRTTQALPYYQDATFTPHWLESDSDSLAQFHQIPAFQLINQEGDTITEQTVVNKIYITDFFFTVCPGICPKMTKNMTLLQEAFLEDEEVLLLSHSVTPEYDSVAVLKAYAEEKGIISDKWHLLTGNRQEIYQLGRQSYFVEEDLGLERAADDFLHTEHFVLVDQNRHIRGIYNGLNKAAVQQLMADVRFLQGDIVRMDKRTTE